MNDDQFQRTVTAWLIDDDTTPPDSLQSARQVVARLPLVRQRSRWWPLPLLRRTSAPTGVTNTTAYQPRPTPATNGHAPTVIGRTTSMLSPVKAITAGALVFAIGGVLLIAQAFDRAPAIAPGAEAETDALRPAMVTGTIVHHAPSGGETTGRMETNDARLTGDIRSDWTLEDVPDPTLPDAVAENPGTIDEYARLGAQLAWATLHVENDGGTWVGQLVCAPTLFTNGFEDPCFIELTGSGAYDGLSALLVERDRLEVGGYAAGDEVYELDGLVFPGELPPDR